MVAVGGSGQKGTIAGVEVAGHGEVTTDRASAGRQCTDLRGGRTVGIAGRRGVRLADGNLLGGVVAYDAYRAAGHEVDVSPGVADALDAHDRLHGRSELLERDRPVCELGGVHRVRGELGEGDGSVLDMSRL